LTQLNEQNQSEKSLLEEKIKRLEGESLPKPQSSSDSMMPVGNMLPNLKSAKLTFDDPIFKPN
jgi:hypothetical protein